MQENGVTSAGWVNVAFSFTDKGVTDRHLEKCVRQSMTTEYIESKSRTQEAKSATFPPRAQKGSNLSSKSKKIRKQIKR